MSMSVNRDVAWWQDAVGVCILLLAGASVYLAIFAAPELVAVLERIASALEKLQ